MPPQTLAVFDFDGTLVYADSFTLLCRYFVGWTRLGLWVLCGVIDWLMRGAQGSHRSHVKRFLCRHILKDRTRADLAGAVQFLKRRLRWKEIVHDRYMWHQHQGHQMMIISGALDLYLAQLIGELAPDFVACTELEWTKDRITGNLVGENCIGIEKAYRLQKVLDQFSVRPELFVYGNSAQDHAMLNLADHQFWIDGHEIKSQ